MRSASRIKYKVTLSATHLITAKNRSTFLALRLVFTIIVLRSGKDLLYVTLSVGCSDCLSVSQLSLIAANNYFFYLFRLQVVIIALPS